MQDPHSTQNTWSGGRLDGSALRGAYLHQQKSGQRLRARDAAKTLGVSECELVACRAGDGVVRLDPQFTSILQALPAVGEVMALTRNEHCVHEKHGAFGHVSIGPGHAPVLNHAIDLRLFLGHWRHGFSVAEGTPSRPLISLQFFGIDGGAVHKVYLTDKSNRSSFDDIVEQYRAADQSPHVDIAPLPAKPREAPDSDIDAVNLRTHWRALQDTHDFSEMLREFGVTRSQAMRLSEQEFAYRVEPRALRIALEAASTTQTPILCFVGNPGCIQIHTGPITRLKATGPWFNILDPGFNLHLREDAIASAWVVRKPTSDGVVTSLELFDADGFCFVQFFGARKPGEPELEAWRMILHALPQAEQTETI
jgi:putative hemin transport protein